MFADRDFGFSRTSIGFFLLGLLATGAGFLLVFLLTKNTETRYLFALLLIPVIVLVVRRQALSARQKALVIGIMGALILLFALPILIMMYRNIQDPPQWDFQLFWTYGRASATGLNPYHPGNLAELAQPIHPSEALLAELFFFYPPPSLFLFAPLGWFDIHTAFAVWYVFQILVFLLAIGLLWKTFWGDSGLPGLMLSGTLVLMFLPTWETLYTAQINLPLLVFILLFWRNRDRPIAGMWLALAIFVKPIALVLLLYPLLKLHWRTFLFIGVTMGVATLFTILVYGPDMLVNYFASNPIANDMPVRMYTEGNVQSLLATIQRLTQYNQGTPVLQPLFLLAVFILTGITSVLTYRLDEHWADWLLGLILVLALLIFPKTLTHYSVLLLVPIFVLLGRFEELPRGRWLATGLTVLVFYCVQAASGFHFYAYVFMWLALTGIGTGLLRHPYAVLPDTHPAENTG